MNIRLGAGVVTQSLVIGQSATAYPVLAIAAATITSG